MAVSSIRITPTYSDSLAGFERKYLGYRCASQYCLSSPVIVTTSQRVEKGWGTVENEPMKVEANIYRWEQTGVSGDTPS